MPSQSVAALLNDLDVTALVVDADGLVLEATAGARALFGEPLVRPGSVASGLFAPASAYREAWDATRATGSAVSDRPLQVTPAGATGGSTLLLVSFASLGPGATVLRLRPPFDPRSSFSLPSLEALLRLSREAVAVTRTDQRIVAVNPAACELSGYAREELLGRTTGEVGLFADVPAREVMIAELRQRGEVRDVPLPLRRKDGSARDVLLSAQFVHVAGEPLGMFLATDVTELREAREGRDEAAASAMDRAALLHAIFEASPASISVTRASDGAYVAVNPAFERSVGLSADTVLGRTSHALGLVATREEELAGLAALGAQGRLAAAVHQTRPDGHETHALYSAVMVDLGGAPHVVAVTLDTTAQHELEEQVQHSRRLEAVGQLAGGVAHDFNNVLTAIISSAELLAARPDIDPDLTKVLLDAAQRGADLTRQLLAFSRKRKIAAAPFDAHEAIRSTVALLRRTIDPRVAVALHLDAPRPHLHGDAGVLGSALLNLGLNARDAMPAGGRLTFATRQVELGPQDCVGTLLPIAPGPHLELRVTDTGSGIPPEVLHRIFEPFFTTKAVGSGTGLGLAVVHGAVADHRGTLRVQSTPGAGSAFTLLLPLAELPLPAPAPGPSATSPRAGHVLVVEDNASVAATAMALLRSLGLTSSHAADGVEALQRLGGDEAFDLVLLDLVMPRLGGREALPEIRRRRPGLPVILTSGYNEDADLDALLASQEVAAFLPKPFRLADLREVLSRVLGAAPATREV